MMKFLSVFHAARRISVAIMLPRRRGPFWSGVWLATLLPTLGSAEDVVHYQTQAGKDTRRTGEIVRWQGQELTLSTGGREKKIDATRLIRIETRWPDALTTARAHVQRRQFPEAIVLLREAQESESREWVRAIITAELVQGLDATEQPWPATLEFLRLYTKDPDTRFFNLLPLPWASNLSQSPPTEETKKWMASNNSLLKLVGASWRMTGSDRSRAIAILEQLTTDLDPRIGQLATAQLWRAKLLTVTEQDLSGWTRQTGRIPSPLRAGPIMVLAAANKRLGHEETAALQLMKIPILYPEKMTLASTALFQCSSILENAGKVDKANRLRRELVRDYPDSALAKLVRQNLENQPRN